MNVLVIRLLLAAVFATAGVAKLAGRRGTIEGLRSFGVPRRLAGPLAVALPLLELAVAGALLPERTAEVAAFAAAALLGVFTVAVAYQLARGRRPECNCFGRLQPRPIGPLTLARNAVLLALAVAVAVASSRGTTSPAPVWLDDPLEIAIAALALLAVAQAALFVALLRRHGRLLVQLQQVDEPSPAELPLGGAAPEFELPGLSGERVTLAALREDGLPVLLLFSDPGCGPCSALLPEVGRWQARWAGDLVLAIVSNSSLEESRALAEMHGLTLVLSQEAHAVGLAYGALGTPMAVLVDATGHIASPVAAGEDAIAELVAEAVSTKEVTLGVS